MCAMRTFSFQWLSNRSVRRTFKHRYPHTHTHSSISVNFCAKIDSTKREKFHSLLFANSFWCLRILQINYQKLCEPVYRIWFWEKAPTKLLFGMPLIRQTSYLMLIFYFMEHRSIFTSKDSVDEWGENEAKRLPNLRKKPHRETSENYTPNFNFGPCFGSFWGACFFSLHKLSSTYC